MQAALRTACFLDRETYFKRRKNMSKKILAILLALVMVCGLAACGAKTEEPTEAETTDLIEEISEEISEEVSEAVSEEASEIAEEISEEVSEEVSEAVSEEEAEEASEEASEEAETVAVPSTTEEILKVYNDAINGAISAKAGYSKSRTTKVNSLDGGAVLKLGVVQDAVGDFLGEGTNTYNNAKGKTEFMSKASLTAADVKSATCTEKDGKYTIVLELKDGASSCSASGKTDTSPLNRSGLYVGETDKSEFDYKSAQNIYVAVNGLEDGSVESVKGTTSNAKITLVCDAESGKISTLDASFNFSADLTNVKYTIAKVATAKGDCSTIVSFSKFAY